MKVLEEVGSHLQQETDAKVIITGVIPPAANANNLYIGNMLLEGRKPFYQAMQYNGKSYSGTGDLFASVIMGGMMRGEDVKKSVQLAVAFLTKAIHDSVSEGVPEIEGVHFEKYLGMLI
jgi:pyridoxine kinase